MLFGPGARFRPLLGHRSGMRQAADQFRAFGLHAAGQAADVGQQGRVRDQPDVQGAGQGSSVASR